MNSTDPTEIELPSIAPVMVLPATVLFPGSLLPLFIFEKRYREMLAWALEHDRMFCLALLRKDREEWRSPTDLHKVAGLGLVRASVGHDDGTSHLILQGLTRVEFTGFEQTEPFAIAKVRPVEVRPVPSGEEATLSAEVLELCAQHRAKGLIIPDTLDQQIAAATDPGALSDLVAHIFIRDPYRQQEVLEAGAISARLHTLIAHLRAELA